MEYTINKLAKLAGVSTRTLRYYDEIGLLSPVRIRSNGYRIYGQQEIDRLQQILFYRELGMPLDDIRQIVLSKDFDGQAALENHLTALHAKRQQLDTLIATVKKTIQAKKGDLTMSDKEKFDGFLENLVDENEQQYGDEIRAKYGDAAIDSSNAKVKGMSQAQYTEVERLSAELNATLQTAFEQGDPASELAQKACALHKQWLCYYWENYSKKAHIGLAQMYVADPRFTAYYDAIAPGCAAFLRDAIVIFCQ